MSEHSTQKTLDLFTDVVPAVFEELDSSRNECWNAVVELTIRSKELSEVGEVDDLLIREMSQYNAGSVGLDYAAADNTIDQKMYSDPVRIERVWQGTGTSISFFEGKPVHYFNKPGYVEAQYGPGFPYIMAKTGWMAYIAQQGFDTLDNRGGYQEITRKLRETGGLKQNAIPHIGAVAAWGDKDHKGSRPLYVASASGILPMPWVHDLYSEKGYAAREVEDQALLDGFSPNLRAGLYDAAYGDMNISSLRGADHCGQTYATIANPEFYKGVDIN